MEIDAGPAKSPAKLLLEVTNTDAYDVEETVNS